MEKEYNSYIQNNKEYIDNAVMELCNEVMVQLENSQIFKESDKYGKQYNAISVVSMIMIDKILQQDKLVEKIKKPNSISMELNTIGTVIAGAVLAFLNLIDDNLI